MKKSYNIKWAIIFLFLISTLLYSKEPTAEEMLITPAQGREFWIALPPNEVLNWYDPVTEMYITSAVDTKVTLEFPHLGVKLVKDISAMHITTFTNLKNELNVLWEVRESEKVTNKGIRITSPDPISVYVLNAKRWSSDGFLALPVSALGTKYIHNSYYDFHGRNGLGDAPWANGFLIVAAYDNTHVNIKLKGVGKGFAKTLGGHEIGDTWSVKLNKGQTYLVQGDGKTRGVFDLSGSIIEADKPVGFFSYHNRTMIPSYNRYPGMNHLVEMMVPVTAWGKKYVTIELKRETDLGDFFRVVASQPNTTFKGTYYDKKSGEVLGHADGFLKEPGDFMEFYEIFAEKGEQYHLVRGVSVWKADKPILVCQYAYSHLLDNQILFDPFMILVVPEEQYLKKTVFQTPSSEQFLNNWFNLIAVHDTSDLEKNDLRSIKLDGTPLWTLDKSFLYNKVPGTNLYWARTNVGIGGHVVEGDTKFGGYIYGFGRVDGYGWPAAMLINNLEEIDTLPPLLTKSGKCGNFDIKTTEKRNGNRNDNPRQVDQGVNEIKLLPGSYNYELVFPIELIPFPPVYDYNFSINVIDNTHNAFARFSITDRANNTTIDSVRYNADSLSLTPDSFVFGNVRVMTSKHISTRLRNEKQETVHIFSIKLKQNKSFKIVKGAIPPETDIDLSYLQSYDLEIAYYPTEEGPEPNDKDYDTLIIETKCADFVWPLEGRGIMPRIDVEDWNAGAVIVNSSVCKKSQTGFGLKIGNNGTDTLTISDISNIVAPFALTNPFSPELPILIPPDTSVYLEDICFTPLDTLTYSLNVLFKSNAGAGDSIATLKGSGIVPGPYVTNKNWMERRVKTINDSLIFLRNGGNTGVYVTGLGLDNTNNNFTITKITPDVNITPLMLMPEDDPNTGVTKEIIIAVRYEPQNEGDHSVKVVPVFDDDGITPGSIYGLLEGVGILPKIEATGYEYKPAILLGTTHPDTGYIYIKSISETADLWIEEIRWKNQAQHDFAWVSTPPSKFILKRNTELKIPVTFKPAGLNRRIEDVEIISDAAPGPEFDPRVITTVQLIGEAIEIGIKTDSLDFGSIFTCDNTSGTITVTNTSSTNVARIDSIIFVDGDNTLFKINSVFPINIPANSSTNIEVEYNPLTAGNHYVLAQVYTNFGNDYYSLLSGSAYTVNVKFSLQKWSLQDQTDRKILLEPGSVIPIEIYVNSDDNWIDAGFNEFKIEIIYYASAMAYNGNLILGNVLDDSWTVTATETLDHDFRRLLIEGQGTTPVNSNGVLATPEFTIFLFDDKQFIPTIQVLTLGDKDGCVIAETEQGFVQLNSCVIDLRSIIVSSTEYTVQSVEPNPVINNSFELKFSLAFDSDIKLELFNNKGELEKVLINGNKKAGEYEITVTTDNLHSGAYFIKLTAPGVIKSKSFVISK